MGEKDKVRKTKFNIVKCYAMTREIKFSVYLVRYEKFN